MLPKKCRVEPSKKGKTLYWLLELLFFLLTTLLSCVSLLCHLRSVNLAWSTLACIASWCSERHSARGQHSLCGRRTVRSVQLSIFDLADLHHLHTQQLNLGTTVLQHLLGSRKHLPVLEDKQHNDTFVPLEKRQKWIGTNGQDSISQKEVNGKTWAQWLMWLLCYFESW